ncbi:hypothetical protein LGH70_22925 [Hymenobacter sp. BT635]|uniref:Lipoprotein n=1 Tax=Hymenobacter nitidus TaxID=2880929 RepID=A0ABS8AMN0_9BACT|nr:hypothetical protein [Hymenobacter nitidus]MCB2380465.1 hypothetical protein [Hymenobacter nitidus]
MRPFFLVLGALGACTTSRVSAPAALTYYVMRSKLPAEYAAADTTVAYAAVQDFARHIGNPYALLYMVTVSGHPDRSRCLRVVQRGPGQFTAYVYQRPGQVDSTTFSSSALEKMLTTPAGYFSTMCLDYSSVVRYEMLWVKQGPTTMLSLVGEFTDLPVPKPPSIALAPVARGLEQQGTPFVQPADSAVLKPALDLLQEVKRLKL